MIAGGVRTIDLIVSKLLSAASQKNSALSNNEFAARLANKHTTIIRLRSTAPGTKNKATNAIRAPTTPRLKNSHLPIWITNALALVCTERFPPAATVLVNCDPAVALQS